MSKRIPTGRVFQKVYTDRQGEKRKTSTWHLKYYGLGGKPVEVSSGTENYDEAVTILRQKIAHVAANAYEYTEDPGQNKGQSAA